MKWLYYHLYRWLMRLAHKHDWHYAPPTYPEGDTMLWCQWCGFRQVIRRSTKSISTNCPQEQCAAAAHDEGEK